MVLRPTGRTRVAAVIGDPVRHSLSPVIHNAAFQALDLDWTYVAFEVPAGGGAGAVAGMRALGLAGMNVTMPLKGEVADAVDRCSVDAAALGAVNTVHWEAGELVGDNTDGAGFLDALRIDEGVDAASRRCVVLGAGGAARAVVLALRRAGAAEIVVVNRTPARGEEAAALGAPVARVGEEADVANAELVVNATPVGMGRVRRLRPGAGEGGEDDRDGPHGGLPCDPDLLHAGQLVVDLVYDPPVTPLLTEARRRGAGAVNGLGMLIHQAAHAFRLFTGEDPPLEVMSAAAVGAIAARDDVSGAP